VELTRVIQYILAIAIGTHTTISSLFSSGLWQDMFSGINQITVPDVIWEAVGFVIIFAIYNVILFRILKKSTVAAFMKRANITHFEVASFQTAMILAYKNLFLIPVSMIYLFNILKLI
jgi:hypothetical protein